MYKPATGHSNDEDRDAAHEEAAKREIKVKHNDFKTQFILAPFAGVDARKREAASWEPPE